MLISLKGPNLHFVSFRICSSCAVHCKTRASKPNDKGRNRGLSGRDSTYSSQSSIGPTINRFDRLSLRTPGCQSSSPPTASQRGEETAISVDSKSETNAAFCSAPSSLTRSGALRLNASYQNSPPSRYRSSRRRPDNRWAPSDNGGRQIAGRSTFEDLPDFARSTNQEGWSNLHCDTLRGSSRDFGIPESEFGVNNPWMSRSLSHLNGFTPDRHRTPRQLDLPRDRSFQLPSGGLTSHKDRRVWPTWGVHPGGSPVAGPLGLPSTGSNWSRPDPARIGPF
ncbi:unnamed protein product, partial [Protopolystoma xenopodis]